MFVTKCNLRETQELHELLGVAIETVGLDDANLRDALTRAREISALFVSDALDQEAHDEHNKRVARGDFS